LSRQSDPDNEYLSDGITDELIDALAKIAGLRLASRTSVFALKGKSLDVRAVGALLGTSVVLEGTGGERRPPADHGAADLDRRRAADLVATLRPEAGRRLRDSGRDRRDDRQHAPRDDVASLSEHVPRRYTENIQAYGLYLKGRYAWNKRTQEGVAEAIGYFEQAIAEDRSYAPAYAGLADSYALDVDYRAIPSTRRTGAPRNTRTRRCSLTRPFPRPMRHSHGASSSTIGIGRGRSRISPRDRAQSALRQRAPMVRLPFGLPWRA